MICLLVVVLVVSGGSGCARTESKRSFNLPAGRADSTLMQFAKQAEVEIVYDVKVVGGTLTNTVLGEYEPNDALNRMLAGTGLVVERDKRTGAFAIVEGKPEAVDGDGSTRWLQPREDHGLLSRGRGAVDFTVSGALSYGSLSALREIGSTYGNAL